MSQYKDQITGDIIWNLRVKDSKFVNIDPKIYFHSIGDKNLLNTTQNDKPSFSEGSFIYNYQKTNNSGAPYIYLKSVSISNKFTISLWGEVLNVKTSHTVGGWDHGSLFLLSNNYRLDLRFCSTEAPINNGNRGLVLYPSNSNNALTYNSANNATVNTWDHYGLTYDGSTFKLYINGQLSISMNYSLNSNDFANIHIGACCGRNHSFAIDDFVLINNQILWDSNFTVPDNYLTGTNYTKYRSIFPDIDSRKIFESSQVIEY